MPMVALVLLMCSLLLQQAIDSVCNLQSLGKCRVGDGRLFIQRLTLMCPILHMLVLDNSQLHFKTENL